MTNHALLRGPAGARSAALPGELAIEKWICEGPASAPAAETDDIPLIAREAIGWTGGVGNRPLRIALAFENPGDRPTKHSVAYVQRAGFGAFLAWKPLVSVSVPPIRPGSRHVVEVAGPAALVPGRPLSADLDNRLAKTLRSDRYNRTRDRLFEQRVSESAEGTSAAKDRVALQHLKRRMQAYQEILKRRLEHEPAFPMELGVSGSRDVMSSARHWVGNLNVFPGAGAPAVERHVGRAIGLRPGAINEALFCVGDRPADSYTFESPNCEAGWTIQLMSPWGPVVLGKPVELDLGFAMFRVAIRPPEHAESGRLVIEVTRQSCGTKVPVEFELDVRSAGAKCWFL